MTRGNLTALKGTTNMFNSGGGSKVLVVPKTIIDDLQINTNNKVFFKILYNKNKKEIIYQYIGEEEK